MIRHFAYFIEECIKHDRLPEISLNGVDSIDAFHASTVDHLGIFLEWLCTKSPLLRIRITTHLSLNEIHRSYKDFNRILGKFDITFLSPTRLRKIGYSADMAVMLHSSRAGGKQASRDTVRAAFTKISVSRKFIIDGDGSIWKGDIVSRAKRKLLSLPLRLLVPIRDRSEQKSIDEKLIGDPGYDQSDPPRVDASRVSHHRTILSFPRLVEQCLATGTIVKPDLLERSPEDSMYEGGYHFAQVHDRRYDWKKDNEDYQEQRWRNIHKVGLALLRERGSCATALDIGCGTGALADKLTKQGYNALGIDISATSISKAKQVFPDTKFERVSLGTVVERGRTFDLIVASHVLEHIHNDRAFLGMVRRLMKPTSFLYIEVPWFDLEPIKSRPFWWRQDDHCREYTKLGLYTLLASIGFKVLSHNDSLDAQTGMSCQFLSAQPGVMPRIS